jgi:hypothetical protein
VKRVFEVSAIIITFTEVEDDDVVDKIQITIEVS